MEEALLQEEGVAFAWSKTNFECAGYAMLYWTYRMLCERVENQATKRPCVEWEDDLRWDQIRDHLRWSPIDMSEGEAWDI
jgi:hypothetical protein